MDLRTGELRPALQSDMIVKSTAAAPSAAMECPTWLRFLDEATDGDADLQRFLQQWAGYCLTGITREHALIFVYGPGGNGKTVFVNVLGGILGDYAAVAPMETFAASHSDRHPTDLAMLRGARLVTASETEEGRAWAETRIKTLTGGDRVSARFMRQDFFTYSPQFKITAIGNHKPVLRNVDDAARRRFNIVPFIHKPENPDPDLETKLQAEWPGILRWMIEGCRNWQANGLTRPETVRTATAQYFEDQDRHGIFLQEECDVDPGNEYRTATSAELFQAWVEHCKGTGEEPGSHAAFSEALQRHGIVKDKGGKGRRIFKGVRLKPRPEWGGR